MLGRFGKRHATMAVSFIPTAIGFGGAAFIGIVYLTEWKVIAANIPFYGGKFKNLKSE